MYNTIYYTIGVVGVGTVVAILLALLNMKGAGAYRTIMYLPSVVPLVATSIVFLWFLNPQYGVLNSILGFFGCPPWAGSPTHVGQTVLDHAGPVGAGRGGGDLPGRAAGRAHELYEAADIDGAGWWSRFWNVTPRCSRR